MSYVTKSEIFLHSMREIDKWLLMSEIFTIKRAHEDCVKNLGIWVDQQCVKCNTFNQSVILWLSNFASSNIEDNVN